MALHSYYFIFLLAAVSAFPTINLKVFGGTLMGEGNQLYVSWDATLSSRATTPEKAAREMDENIHISLLSQNTQALVATGSGKVSDKKMELSLNRGFFKEHHHKNLYTLYVRRMSKSSKTWVDYLIRRDLFVSVRKPKPPVNDESSSSSERKYGNKYDYRDGNMQTATIGLLADGFVIDDGINEPQEIHLEPEEKAAFAAWVEARTPAESRGTSMNPLIAASHEINKIIKEEQRYDQLSSPGDILFQRIARGGQALMPAMAIPALGLGIGLSIKRLQHRGTGSLSHAGGLHGGHSGHDTQTDHGAGHGHNSGSHQYMDSMNHGHVGGSGATDHATDALHHATDAANHAGDMASW